MNKSKISLERKGELIVLLEIVIVSISPLLIKSSDNLLPPIFFLSLSMILAGLIFLGFLFFDKKLPELKDKKALPNMLGATFFIVILFFSAKFFLGQKTSPGNLAVLVSYQQNLSNFPHHF